MHHRVIILLSIALLVSCAYESEEDLFGQNICEDENISYKDQVEPIMRLSCYGCHGQALTLGGVFLEGYSNTSIFAKNGSLLGVIKHQAGYAPMPQNASMLPDCQIRQIESWINDGAMNN